MRVIGYIMAGVVAVALAGSARTVPRKAWRVETDDPRTQRLEMIYGETIDLECTFVNYVDSIDISGATVTLHAVTNGMAAGESYQVTGVAGDDGLATVRVVVNEWIPQGLESVNYTLAVVQTNSVQILRAYGSVYLSGSSVASTAAPIPVSVYDQLSAEISGYVEMSNDDMLALSNNMAEAIFALSNNMAEAISAVDTKQITKLWGGNSTTNYMDGDGVMWDIRSETNTVKGYLVTFCSESELKKGDVFWFNSSETYTEVNNYPWPSYVATITNVYFFKNGDVNDLLLMWHYDSTYLDQYYDDKSYVGEWTTEPNQHTEFVTSGSLSEANLEMRTGSIDPFLTLTATNSAPFVTISTNIIDRTVGKNGTVIIIGQSADDAGTITQQVAQAGSETITSEFLGRSEVLARLESYSPAFSNMLLYVAGNTNYYPRWDADQSTFVVEGVVQ